MSFLSDFFIAPSEQALKYEGGDGVPSSDRYQARRISPLEAAGMLSVLRKVNQHVELIREFRLLTPEDAEEWTMSVPADMVEKLARIAPEDVHHVAEAFAAKTEQELHWTAEDFKSVVAGLAELARRAIASGKSMYLWNSL